MKDKKTLTEVFAEEGFGIFARLAEVLPEGLGNEIFDLHEENELGAPKKEEEFVAELSLPMQIMASIINKTAAKYTSLLKRQEELECCPECAKKNGTIDEKEFAELKNLKIYAALNNSFGRLFDCLALRIIQEKHADQLLANQPFGYSIKKSDKGPAIYLKLIPMNIGLIHLSSLTNAFDESAKENLDDGDFNEMAKEAGIDISPGITPGKA